MALLITEEETRHLLSVKTVVPVVEEAFRLAGGGSVENPSRTRLPIKFQEPNYEGFLQTGGAIISPQDIAGLKVFANFGERVPGRQFGRGWNMLFRISTGELLAVLQSFQIGLIRTAAVTAVATKYLTPVTASVVGVYGVGKLAEDQLAAICSVRSIQKVHVHNRTPEKAVAFCTQVSKRHGVEAISESKPEEVARNADIIITATSSFSPVLFQQWLVRPCLVAAVGANHWYRREIDAKAFAAAEMIVVDGIETAKTEGGALLYAVSQGQCLWSQVEELGRIVAGRTPPPDFSAGTVLFSSHGLTLTDVAVSGRLYNLAIEQGIGREIDLDSGRIARAT